LEAYFAVRGVKGTISKKKKKGRKEENIYIWLVFFPGGGKRHAISQEREKGGCRSLHAICLVRRGGKVCFSYPPKKRGKGKKVSPTGGGGGEKERTPLRTKKKKKEKVATASIQAGYQRALGLSGPRTGGKRRVPRGLSRGVRKGSALFFSGGKIIQETITWEERKRP